MQVKISNEIIHFKAIFHVSKFLKIKKVKKAMKFCIKSKLKNRFIQAISSRMLRSSRRIWGRGWPIENPSIKAIKP